MTHLVEQVVLGKVLRTYGDNGELIVRFYEDFAEEYSDLSEPVWVVIDSLPTPLFFKSMSARGVSKATVVFDDFDSEFRAQMLVGLEFYVNRYAEQEDDQLYMEDLVGFEIVADAQVQGTIVEYIDDPMNPLFEIERNEECLLIPAHDDMIVQIDEEQKCVVMNLPQGIFDL